jgi:hypothetical protein
LVLRIKDLKDLLRFTNHNFDLLSSGGNQEFAILGALSCFGELGLSMEVNSHACYFS